MKDIIRRLQDSAKVRDALGRQAAADIKQAATKLAEVLSSGHRVFLLGDRENHALAHHMALEALGTDTQERRPLAMLALPAEAGGHPDLAARFLQAHAAAGDLLVLFAAQGDDPMVAKALEAATSVGAQVVTVLGAQSQRPAQALAHIAVPAANRRKIAEGALIVGHVLQSTLEHLLFESEKVGTTKNLIRFNCPSCDEKIFSEERFAGRKGSCPGCGAPIVVPHTAAEPVNINVTDEKKSREKRVHLRFSVQDCMLQYSLTSFFETGPLNLTPYPLENLSQGGCQFLLTVPEGPARKAELKVGDVIWTSIDVPAFIEPLNARSTVRRVEHVPEKNSHRIGLEFMELKEVDREKLRKLCDNVVLRNIRRSQGLY